MLMAITETPQLIVQHRPWRRSQTGRMGFAAVRGYWSGTAGSIIEAYRHPSSFRRKHCYFNLRPSSCSAYSQSHHFCFMQRFGTVHTIIAWGSYPSSSFAIAFTTAIAFTIAVAAQ
jgi:hypothetical protein